MEAGSRKKLTIVVSEREGRLVEEVAHRLGESVSGFGREAILRHATDLALGPLSGGSDASEDSNPGGEE